MNKILIALVLIFGLSGNVFSNTYVHCATHENYGYIFSKGSTDHKFIHYNSILNDFVLTAFSYIDFSEEHVTFRHIDYHHYRIDRKTLKIERRFNGKGEYRTYGECSLVNSYEELFRELRKKRSEKTKGNKF